MFILPSRFTHAKNKALRAAAMICISTLGAFSLALAQRPNNPDQEIAQARTKYEQGEFNEAIEILNRCMQQDGLTANPFEASDENQSGSF